VIRIGITGATGYGGRELLRLLIAHPEAELTALSSTSAAGEKLSDVLPAFRKLCDLRFEAFDAEALAAKCDVVFVGVPGRESMSPVAALRAAGVKVIDIGPDFRLRNTADFRQWYKAEHTAEAQLAEAVYGMVPWYREAIAAADLVAVPGCYPISCILPLRPLMEAPAAAAPVVIDAISGISGAGRTLNEAFHYPEMAGNLKAYKLGAHQHTPEIEQELLHRVKVQFTPHVAPLTRGILTTITLRPAELFDPAPYYACYENEPFIRVLGECALAEVKHVRGTNFCDFGWVADERTGNLMLVSAIDNLMGGTAGMAVQCFNLMFGFAEDCGLRWGGMAP
jgi:N-acetyl-gamma-glutamyl-phosphate reductase